MPFRSASLCVALCTLITAQTRRPQEFFIHTLNGSRINTARYTGKVVVIEFLLTTCSHCQRLAATLKKIQSQYGPERVQVLGCTVEDMAPVRVAAFVAQFAPGFPVGFADRDVVNAYLEHDPKALLKMPQLVFIDRAGVKKAKYIGEQPFFGKDEESNIRRQIDALLGKERAALPRR
jgi:thiol-disulfide isomerase/thioredoxin